VRIDAAVSDSRCRLTVDDNGIGFEEKYAERIFQMFERLHGRGAYEGTGIGLAICRRIAERHGGTIEARSKTGEGSTFTVTLPVKQAHERGHSNA
jgi:signal transduction histidine kinase